MASITMELPEIIFPSLGLSPDEISTEIRIAAAALWYKQGKISQETAAKFAGLDRTDFILTLARMGIDTFQIDFNDLDRELRRG